MWSLRGTGYSAGNPNDTMTVLRPKRWRADGTVPGVILLHGAGASDVSNYLNRPSNLAALAAAICEEGYACVAPYMGGDTFGNDTALGMVTDASTYLGTLGAKAGRRVLLGASMGGGVAYAWARANPTLVSCLVGLIPMSDVNDVVVNDRAGNANAVHVAYGQRTDAGCGTTSGSAVVSDAAILSGDAGRRVAGPGIPANASVGSVIAGVSFQIIVGGSATPATATSASVALSIGGWVNAVHGPTHNPESFKAQLAGLRAQVWYATDDAVVPPATVTSITSAIGSTAETHTFTGGHTDAALASVDTAAVLTFLRTYA